MNSFRNSTNVIHINDFDDLKFNKINSKYFYNGYEIKNDISFIIFQIENKEIFYLKFDNGVIIL